MSIFSKLITLLRGTAHETGQKAVDANALRILDQEMRDAGAQLTRSREELTKLMAQSKLAQQKIDARAGKMAEYTRYIEGALAKEMNRWPTMWRPNSPRWKAKTPATRPPRPRWTSRW